MGRPQDVAERYVRGDADYTLSSDSVTVEQVEAQLADDKLTPYMIIGTSQVSHTLNETEKETLGTLEKILLGTVFSVVVKRDQYIYGDRRITFFTTLSESPVEFDLRGHQKGGRSETAWGIIVHGGVDRLVEIGIEFRRIVTERGGPADLRALRAFAASHRATDHTNQLRF